MTIFQRLPAAIFAATLLTMASQAMADNDRPGDPPGRAARLNYVSGDVSLRAGGADDWAWAPPNRPLTAGDSLWTDENSRAEAHVGALALRADENTSFSWLALDDNTVQLGLNKGSVALHVPNLRDGETVEVDSPNAAVTLLAPGDYRIDADPDGGDTRVSVRSGEAEVDGSDQGFRVDGGSLARVSGTDRISYDVYGLPDPDGFDSWTHMRDMRAARALSARYVPAGVTGREDLDAAGTWRTDPDYGPVWIPSRVAADWSPFSDGHWVWVNPWGWTWVDAAPWGYATSHYGRWAHLDDGGWAWLPPRGDDGAPIYSPANVAFIRPAAGGEISWFPLGPGESYQPGYTASREYTDRMNAENAWERHERHEQHEREERQAYANAAVAGAIVAISADLFASARHIERKKEREERAAAEMRAEASAQAVVSAPPVAPVKASLVGEARTGTAPPKPPAAAATEHPLMAKKPPPPPPASFAAQQSVLQQNAGKPLAPAETAKLRPAAATIAPVKTVAPAAVKPAAEATKQPASAAPPPRTAAKPSPQPAQSKQAPQPARSEPAPQAQQQEPAEAKPAPAPVAPKLPAAPVEQKPAAVPPPAPQTAKPPAMPEESRGPAEARPVTPQPPAPTAPQASKPPAAPETASPKPEDKRAEKHEPAQPPEPKPAAEKEHPQPPQAKPGKPQPHADDKKPKKEEPRPEDKHPEDKRPEDR
jgi:hypothetical protein